MAVDKEAIICLSRVYSYYFKCNFPLFYVKQQWGCECFVVASKCGMTRLLPGEAELVSE